MGLEKEHQTRIGCLLAVTALLICSFPLIGLYTAFIPHTRPYLIWGVGSLFIGLALLCFPWFFKRLAVGIPIYVTLSLLVLCRMHTVLENPTTQGRTARIEAYGGEELVFRGQEILDQIKKQQQLMVLSLLTDYEGIESITFTDISEDPHHRTIPGGPQFHVEGLINGRYPFYFGTDLHDVIQRVDNWEDMETYPGIVKRDQEGASVQFDLDDLDVVAHQKTLDSIEVIYYTKDDIYKDIR